MIEAVRSAAAADVDELRRLEDRARTALIDQRGGSAVLDELPPIDWRSALGEVVVATIDDVVVGYLHLTIDQRTATVASVYVDPQAREVGLGDEMLTVAFERARQAGCDVLEGWSLPGDRSTKNLYERAGVVARKIIVSRRLSDPSTAERAFQ
ncbi:MAG TPA: GNAT family N-acetyltransferase [Ilumatobacteraceae bacterium]|nr:GNAT family N-acetyltransferase [Ilumatobacteraceae bacterium]